MRIVILVPSCGRCVAEHHNTRFSASVLVAGKPRFKPTDPPAQRSVHLHDRVGQVLVVQIDHVDPLTLADDHPPGDADHGAALGHVGDHHGAGADPRAASDGDVAEHGRADADHHEVLDGGMPLAVLLAGAAESHTLVERHIVADDGRLAYDDAHAVIDEEAIADHRAGMDLDPRTCAHALADVAGKPCVARAMQPMRDPMPPDRPEAGVVGECRPGGRTGRVALLDCRDVCPEARHHHRPTSHPYLPATGRITITSALGTCQQQGHRWARGEEGSLAHPATRSNRTTACAPAPRPLPSNPSPSVVVALTPMRSGSLARAAAMRARISSRYGEIRGR